MNRIVIEQTRDYPKRMKYDPETNSFFETEVDSLSHVRGCTFPYGWLKESGTPPSEHLDVILISRERYELGDVLPIKIIGVFKRRDNDHKLVAVCPERPETELSQLPLEEKKELFGLYPVVDAAFGEGWFDQEVARKIISDFCTFGRQGAPVE